ncbi:MAG: hypothetical protein FJY10_06550 [Bacteroidetes bacterium]|nr:hypothetical protein [Bacteroidota bacterium]
MEEEFKDQISSYNQGELDESQKKAFEEQMAGDPELAREVRLDKDLDQVLADQDTIEFREQLQKSMLEGDGHPGLFAWLLLAASILIILGISAFYLLRSVKEQPLFEHRNPPIVNQQPEDISTPEKQPDKAVVVDDKLAFSPCPELEEMIKIHYRDHNRTLISPGKETNITSDPMVLFKWEPAHLDTAMVKIFNNKNKLIYQSNPRPANYLRIKIKLNPGIYYWQLTLNRNLHSVGRLVVDQQ